MSRRPRWQRTRGQEAEGDFRINKRQCAAGKNRMSGEAPGDAKEGAGSRAWAARGRRAGSAPFRAPTVSWPRLHPRDDEQKGHVSMSVTYTELSAVLYSCIMLRMLDAEPTYWETLAGAWAAAARVAVTPSDSCASSGTNCRIKLSWSSNSHEDCAFPGPCWM